MNEDIEKALFEEVESIVFAPALSIAFPNANFTKPEDEVYLSVKNIPAEPVDYAWGKDDSYMGILQIEVRTPKNTGSLATKRAVDTLVAHFQKELIIDFTGVKLQVYKQSFDVGTFEEDSELFNPVRVYYRSI